MDKLAAYLVRQGPLEASNAVGWALRLAAALEVLHRVGVSHGRVSANAIALGGPSPEGPGFLLDGESLREEVAYHSPERLAGGRASPEDDTWAVSVVLYQLLTASLPFPGTTAAQVRAEILASDAVPLASRGVRHEALQRVLDRSFALELGERLATLEQLRVRLVECMPGSEGLPPLKLGSPDRFRSTPPGAAASREEALFEAETVVDDRPAARAAVGAAGTALPRRRASLPSGPPRISDVERGYDDLPPPTVPSSPGAGRPRAGVPPPGAAASRPSAPAAPPPPPPAAARKPAVSVELSPDELRLRSRGMRLGLWIGGGALALGAVAIAVGLGVGRGGSPAPVPSAAADRSAAPEAVRSSAVPSTTPQAEPTAVGHNGGTASSASAAPSSQPSVPTDRLACMTPLFPPDTFADAKPSFDFLCTETHARRGGTALKVEVVRAGARPGALPLAMQEWAKLGWYEMAVFAVARARCCRSPAPLATPLGIDACPLDPALEVLGTAATGGDTAALDRAIDAYTEVAVCLVQAGASKAFGQSIKPTQASTDAFRQIVDRLRGAR